MGNKSKRGITKATEHDVDSSIIIQLSALGWQPDLTKQGRNVYRQVPKTIDEKKLLGKLRPDYILYADDDSNQSSVIIEAKKPGSTLVAALEQGKKYAALLNTPVVIATDGYRLKTWHMKKGGPLQLNDIELDELFDMSMARHFQYDNIYNSFSRRENLSKKELISKFKRANDILRAAGLDAGIVRFSEFANLMFLKLYLEGSNRNIGGHTWADIERKRGDSLLKAITSMLSHMRKEHSTLFEKTKVTNPPQMEALINILSSFQLSAVRDDIKGMAFECFIHSYTQGLKNDLGQYFTPRHIIKMMVNYLKPQLGESIYDPFCGTGGMLIECFRYINQYISDNDTKSKAVLHKETIYGCDNSSVARIAMMNMIMFGDGHSNIQKEDSYKRLGATKNKYDIVIANIPFSQVTDFNEGYPVAPSSSDQNGDSIGVQHCLESLKETSDARAAIIVPIGFIYKSVLEREREYILNNFHLERVVEITPKCFNPYTEQQTAVLMLRRRKGKAATPTTYYRVDNDGFSQDAYRIPVSGHNDLDKVMEDEGGEEIQPSKDDKYKYKTIKMHCPRSHTRLSEIAMVKKGDNISPKTMKQYTVDGTKPILMAADLAYQHIDYYLTKSNYLINDLAIREKKPFLYPAAATIIGSSGKSSLKNHRGLLGIPVYLSSTVTGIVAKENGMHPYCIFYFFLGFDCEKITYDQGYPGLNIADIENIPIPIYKEAKERSIIAQISDLVELHKKFKDKHDSIISDRTV